MRYHPSLPAFLDPTLFQIQSKFLIHRPAFACLENLCPEAEGRGKVRRRGGALNAVAFTDADLLRVDSGSGAGIFGVDRIGVAIGEGDPITRIDHGVIGECDSINQVIGESGTVNFSRPFNGAPMVFISAKDVGIFSVITLVCLMFLQICSDGALIRTDAIASIGSRSALNNHTLHLQKNHLDRLPNRPKQPLLRRLRAGTPERGEHVADIRLAAFQIRDQALHLPAEAPQVEPLQDLA